MAVTANDNIYVVVQQPKRRPKARTTLEKGLSLERALTYIKLLVERHNGRLYGSTRGGRSGTYSEGGVEYLVLVRRRRLGLERK